MEIRQKITCRFTAIIAILLLLSLLTIYFLFLNFRKEEFNSRLVNRAKSIGQIIDKFDDIDPDTLLKIEKNIPGKLPEETIVVFNAQDQILFSTDKTKNKLFTTDILKKVRLTKEIKYNLKSLQVYGLYYEDAKEKLVVFCSAIDVFGIRKLKILTLILSAVFIVSLIVIYFAGRIFASNALKPISQIVEQVNNISISNLNSRVDFGNGKDEIAGLSDTFNRMLERLESAFKIQKDFIANSSHELRTPLTVITGQLEVTLLQERKAEEYKSVIISVLEDIKSLNQLANRLLILSRVENDFSSDSFHPVRIDDILWRSRAEILKRHKNFVINILFDNSIEEEDHFKIRGNDQLLKTAFGNLIENGCKYSMDNKTDVYLSVMDENVVVEFKDNGIGIPEEEINHIFQPFYRAKNVKRKKGYGIGLSLVQKIIMLHQGTIQVNSTLKKETNFIISIPLN